MKSSSPGVLADDRAESGAVLVIVHMISCWDFEDADKLLPHASRIARHRAPGLPDPAAANQGA